VGTGTCPWSPSAPSAAASPSLCSLSSSPPLFNLVLKICCTLGRLRYGRGDFPNVKSPVATPSLFFDACAVQARGGNVAVIGRECRPEGSGAGNDGGELFGKMASGLACPSVRGESNPSSRATGVEIRLCVFGRAAVATATDGAPGVRRPNDDWELRRGVFSLFSAGEECKLVVLEDSRDERRELVRRVRHADGDGGICICSPNSFKEGGGARCRPNVDQFPSRSMKPRPIALALALGVLLPEELLD
jgi:hypothetical protein